MAAIHKGDYNFSERRQQFEQNKPTGGLRSFLHRRNNSDGVSLMSTSPNNTPSSSSQGHQGSRSTEDRQSAAMAFPKLALDPEPAQPRHSPTRTGREALDDTNSNFNNDRLQPPLSPTKSGLGYFSARFSKDRGSGDASPPKKTRSSTNIVGLLSRPRSNKNLKLDIEQQVRNKENRNPSDLSATDAPPTPIFAQMRSRALGQALSVPSSPYESPADPFASTSMLNLNHSLRPSQSNVSHGQKQRPKSFQPQYLPKPDAAQIDDAKESRGRTRHDEPGDGNRDSPRAKGRSKSRNRILSSITTRGGRKSKSPSPPSQDAGEPYIDPKDIDKHLEAMLDRRNIPENQRHKMRSLTDTIKMEFIRQDWAENEGKNLVRPQTNDSDDSASCMANTSVQDNDKKQSRGRSFTLSRNSWKIGTSPSKGKKKDASVGGHTRNKSVDSAVSERPSSSGASHAGNGIIAKITGQQPSDFVNYLRKVQKPESVEVGKLHKLRLLLRNERVAWTEDFVKQGGMQEIVGLLHRIMAVEWREEHEDALLHENLLCLKALCTTAMALQYLHSIQHTLFPALIGMIFDPEKKGPSEFTTRNIITSVLFTYIQSGTAQERVLRAKAVLAYLRDPQAKEEERPVDFVLGMRRERPYRVWNKEVVNVTKEVFWIFLHQLNVVALPPGHKSSEDIRTTANQADTTTSTRAEQGTSTATDTEPYAYMARHFPQERPPVPAAPYVGGVEWDATNYLASHLDIVNAIIACTPTQAERNALREQLRISGWERCLGGSLRLCKEKFYPAVHDALRNWVAAAADDGWDVRDVRFGPPADSRNLSPKKPAPGAPPSPKKKLLDEPPPRLEMPKLDFMLDGPLSAAP